MGITAEVQKGHTYYRCTKKTGNCSQPYIREEELDRQLSSLLQTISLKPDWAASLNKMLEKDKAGAAQSSAAFVQKARTKMQNLQSKLQRLLDSYLDQDIDQETYRTKKAELMSEKKSLEEKVSRLEQKQTGWLEPMRNWIKEADDLCQIAQANDFFAKKDAGRKIFGSNLILTSRRARLIAAANGKLPLEKHWAAVSAARQNRSKMKNRLNLAGEEGFEPPNARTKTWCLTTWPLPIVGV